MIQPCPKPSVVLFAIAVFQVIVWSQGFLDPVTAEPYFKNQTDSLSRASGFRADDHTKGLAFIASRLEDSARSEEESNKENQVVKSVDTKFQFLAIVRSLALNAQFIPSPSSSAASASASSPAF